MNRKGPGELAGWAVALIIAACCVTFTAVALGVDLVYGMLDPAIVKRGWVPYALTYVTAFCVLAAWLPPARLSRALRVAVLLPAVHAFVIGLAWPAWHALSRFFTNHDATSELVTRFPLAAVVGASLVGFLGFALIIARRRSGEWQHGFVMLALSELLLLGLWLPISIAIYPGGGDWWSSMQPLIDDPLGRALLTVIPPTVIAATFAAAGMLQPARLLAARRRVTGFVGALFAVALVTRADASAREMVLYSNLLPLLFAAMFVAIAALLLFGIALALRSYRAHRAFTKQRGSDGVIVLDEDDAPVAGFEITSWLRGPRVVQRPFAVSVDPGGRSESGHLHVGGGTIPVRGAHIVASLLPATTQLEIGEAYAALRPGDRVRIAGHAAAGGDPFRTSAAPLAGELFVAPFERASSGFTHVALAMWRPCVAYLLIVVAIALPALAAFAAT